MTLANRFALRRQLGNADQRRSRIFIIDLQK